MLCTRHSLSRKGPAAARNDALGTRNRLPSVLPLFVAASSKRDGGSSARHDGEERSASSMGSGPSGLPKDAAAMGGYSRDDMLWYRQQQLWDREMARWDQERQAWSRREAGLLAEIEALRSQLNRVLEAQLSAPAAGRAAPAPAAGPAHAVPHGAAQAGGGSYAAAAAAAAAGSALGAAEQVMAAMRAVDPSFPLMSTSSAAGAPAPAAAADSGADARAASWEEFFSQNALGAQGAAAGAAFGAGGGVAPFGGAASASDSVFAALAAVRDGADVLDGAAGGGAGEEEGAAASGAAAGSELQSSPGASWPPPMLMAGQDDDLYWMNQLHTILVGKGFYPPDEEIEALIFAEGTQSALMYFQAAEGIPETGVADEATWSKLLGREIGPLAPAPAGSATSGDAGGSGGGTDIEVDVSLHVETHGGVMTVEERIEAHASSGQAPAPHFSTGRDGWPVLVETDGGREVHSLQVALQRAGYHCSDDEMQWWQFGEATSLALRTFQACAKLPESGVADAATWRALLGPEAQPRDLYLLKGGEHDEDMSSGSEEGGVWLLGEGRWERRSKQ